MNEPLDPRSAQLLRYERARTDPVEGTKARVFARVQSTLAAPSVQTSNAPPQPPVAPTLGSVAWATLASIVLVGGAAAVFAARATSHATVPVGMQGPQVAKEPVPVGLAPAIASPVPSGVPSEPAAPLRTGPMPDPSSGAPDLAAERLLLDRARSHLLHGHSAAALASIGEHARRFPRGALSEERDALRVEALAAAARYGEARASAARFHSAYPGSLLTPAVDSALRENP
jgi:hypothetical protein